VTWRPAAWIEAARLEAQVALAALSVLLRRFPTWRSPPARSVAIGSRCADGRQCP
jgi:hypothetical protein